MRLRKSLVSIGGNLMDHWILVEWCYKNNQQHPVKATLQGRRTQKPIDLSKLSGYHYDCLFDGLYGYQDKKHRKSC